MMSCTRRDLRTYRLGVGEEVLTHMEVLINTSNINVVSKGFRSFVY